MKAKYKEIECSSVTEIIELLRKYSNIYNNSRTPLMRGEREFIYEPTAGIFRSELARQSEVAIFNEFQRHIPAYSSIEVSNLWQVMALAQHHGLPTRLLDWTRNILVAIYFACEGASDGDSAVWIVWGFDREEHEKLPYSPADLDRICCHTPLVVSPRIQAQAGVFTAHPNGDPISKYLDENDEILKIRIPQSSRLRLLIQLDLIGTNRRSLFPDLDGLAQYYRWRTNPELIKLGLVRN